ncbi:MAG TPA: A/G-specific adenine glycosylase [Luteolibacter sp.]|nr:A/G-specific adenine glycosylase [Luteolibacter sp.]
MLKPRFSCPATDDPGGFRDALHAWFSRHGRDYPWRRTRDPYAVLVSEVMLQQTQIATVLGKEYYTRFLESFPDVHALAVADDAILLKAWEGLGYYRRARMLRETARAVIERHNGEFPSDLVALMALPGIGRYTAGALRAFAFGLPAVLVDGNVSRVLARLMDYAEPVDSSAGSRKIWGWAEQIADTERPRPHHAAIMELGQTHCRPGAPDCLECPVARFCRSRQPAALPVKSRKATVTAIAEHAVWLRRADGRILLHHESGQRRTGLWKLPLRDPEQVAGLPLLAEQIYPITRYRVTLRVHDARHAKPRVAPRKGDAWIAPDDLAGLPLAAPFKRVLTRLIEDF